MSSSTRNTRATPFAQAFFHGTKADLKVGDFIGPGFASNFAEGKASRYIFFTSTLDAAIWGAELALGEGKPRIYVVEPTGEHENDPDLTDQKFPGNPSQSYRSEYPCKVIAEVILWEGHPAVEVMAMQEALARLKEKGIRSLNE